MKQTSSLNSMNILYKLRFGAKYFDIQLSKEDISYLRKNKQTINWKSEVLASNLIYVLCGFW